MLTIVMPELRRPNQKSHYTPCPEREESRNEVEAALAANHLNRTDVTPQAFACLLEQARRYALELLADAQDYAYSANRNDVTRADLMLAREMRADQPMATAMQQPRLMSLAAQVN
jgi:histone H3/H4